MGRIAVLTVALLLLAAAPAAAAPGILGKGASPGVAVDDAGTAHVAWFVDTPDGNVAIEYCQVLRRTRACATRQILPAGESGTGDVQVLVPRPGTVLIVAPLLNDPAILFSSFDGGATFTSRPIGEVNVIGRALFGPGEAIALFSKGTSFARFGIDGSGPPEYAVEFGGSLEGLFQSLAYYEAGYAAFFGTEGIRSVLWNGLGDPNLPESWVEGPRMGGDRAAATAAGGKSGTWVAYTDRRGNRSELRVRRLRAGKLGPSKRVSRDDPLDTELAQGPRGNMIALWRPFGDRVRYVRSRNGRRWTKPRILFRGHDPVFLHPVLGRRGGWMVWGEDSASTIRIAALPGRPKR